MRNLSPAWWRSLWLSSVEGSGGGAFRVGAERSRGASRPKGSATRRRRMTPTRRCLLLTATLSSMFSAACAHDIGAGRHCPMPSTSEIDDYDAIVEAGPDRMAVRWIGRMISYCWPKETIDAISNR